MNFCFNSCNTLSLDVESKQLRTMSSLFLFAPAVHHLFFFSPLPFWIFSPPPWLIFPPSSQHLLLLSLSKPHHWDHRDFFLMATLTSLTSSLAHPAVSGPGRNCDTKLLAAEMEPTSLISQRRTEALNIGSSDFRCTSSNS